MALPRHYLVFETDEKWERYILEHAIDLEFASEEEERAYGDRDDALCKAVAATCESYWGALSEDNIHQNWDWYPNQLRFLEMNVFCLTAEFLEQLRRLLVDDYAGWRITISVYEDEDMDDSTTELGAIMVYTDRIAITQSLVDTDRLSDEVSDWQCLLGAGQTIDNAALYLLREQGYHLSMIAFGARSLYVATKDGRRFSGASGAELIGLVNLWQQFGDEYRSDMLKLPQIEDEIPIHQE